MLGVAAVIWFVQLRHYGATQIQLDAIRAAGTPGDRHRRGGGAAADRLPADCRRNARVH
ncbi:MAG: hypothetical protein ACRDRI_11215 [Pseudonocardiaceae bacterium]